MTLLRKGRRARWWRGDRGSVAAEMTIVAPCLVMLLVFVAVLVHRGVDARLRLDDAAHQAARAASLQRTTDAAIHAAHTTATGVLTAAGVPCRSITVDTTTDGLNPGGTVQVTTTCTMDLDNALLLAVPTTRTLTATATEPIDVWRGTTEVPGTRP